jgi:hypothetical protein
LEEYLFACRAKRNSRWLTFPSDPTAVPTSMLIYLADSLRVLQTGVMAFE